MQDGRKHRQQLILRVQAVAASGVSQEIRVLVDTGAEVNLVRPAIFSDQKFRLAQEQLKLVMVMVRSSMVGGGLNPRPHT